MIVLLQRVLEAQVVRRAEGGQAEEPLGAVGRGLLAFVCAEPGDSAAVIAKAARKTARLRIFEDENGRMNLSAADIGGGVAVHARSRLYERESSEFFKRCIPRGGTKGLSCLR